MSTGKAIVPTQRHTQEPSPQKDSQEAIYTDAAQPLLIYAARIQFFSRHTDLTQLQKRLIQMVYDFEQTLQNASIRAEPIVMVKYFICALLDDVIEYALLEGHGLWNTYALLEHFFQEANADERFFMLLDRLQAEPSMNLALLQFAYVILIYGYQGMYRTIPNGRFILLEKTDQLYHLLNWHYGDFRKSLFIPSPL